MEILWDFHGFPSCGSVHFNDGRIPQFVAILMRPGTPYMLYKDHCNRKSNQQNLGSLDQIVGSEKNPWIYSTSLPCTIDKNGKMAMYFEHITMLHINITYETWFFYVLPLRY
jgi:hypothetical protein